MHTPQWTRVMLNPVGAGGSLSFAATSNSPPMPMVLLITSLPRLRTPYLSLPCSV